ncbi:hypothetical protein D9M69_732820 [compost metagenome]
MVQVLLEELPARQVGGPPVTHGTGNQVRGDPGDAKHQAQHNETDPLHQQQAVHRQPAGEVMDHAGHHQGQQAGP